MAMNVYPADPICTFLNATYKPLEGKTFLATYGGSFQMPQTGNPRDILVVEVQNPFTAILEATRSSVMNTYGQRVWKGIRGPPDNPAVYVDYWLWVEPILGLSEMNSTAGALKFKIETTTVFQCFAEPGNPFAFSHGVSIRASLDQGAQIMFSTPAPQMGNQQQMAVWPNATFGAVNRGW